jgi:hypothetical protein
LGVIEATTIIRAAECKPAQMLSGVLRWSSYFRPSLLVSNIRQGLPSWLAWQAVQRGWPLHVVVGPNQITGEGSDRQWLLLELWAAADDRMVADSVQERDEIIAEMAPLVGIEHILGMQVPNLGTNVVVSDAERGGHGSGYSPGGAQQQAT